MSKIRVLLVGATAAGAFAAASFIPVHADPTVVPTPAGTITADGNPDNQTGHITADGTVTGTPLDGYVTAGNDGVDGPAGVCADDNGSNANAYDAETNPGGSTSPTCTPAPPA